MFHDKPVAMQVVRRVFRGYNSWSDAKYPVMACFR